MGTYDKGGASGVGPRRTGRHKTGEAGFSFIEVIIALSILGIFIGGMCAVLLGGRQLGDLACSHYVAVNLAKNRIERARNMPFESLSDFVEYNTLVDEDGNPDYSGNYRRTTQYTSAGTNLVEMIVTVEVIDRVKRRFDGESEIVRSYIANIPTR